MSSFKEYAMFQPSKNWIYIGADIYNTNFSKVGKTTLGPHTRHTSSQSPGYFIYTAFNIVNSELFCKCDVHSIEKELLSYLTFDCKLVRLPHISTGTQSECFALNPDEMTGLVESFIEESFGSCVTYENSLHGWMSRYQCDKQIVRFYQQSEPSLSSFKIPSSLDRKASSYFTGNQEEYTIPLGGGYYLDLSTGIQRHIDDD